MKKWLLAHLGLLAFIGGYVVVCFFPILNGDILPDPWETLFDWAGEFYAYTYLAILIGLVNLAPAALLAGLLDRCPLWHTTATIFITMCTAMEIWPGGFFPFHAFICALIVCVLLSIVYLTGRKISALAVWLWNRRLRTLPA